MASKSAVLRLVPMIRGELSRSNAVRLDQVVEAIKDDGSVVLAEVLHVLYPGRERNDALTAFRQFRKEVAQAAAEAEVQFSLETDGQTRATPEDRNAWFECEDRVTEAVTRLTQAEVGNVQRYPQDIRVTPEVLFFVCYASEDKREKDKFLKLLLNCFESHPQIRFKLWSDVEIPPGKIWRDEIQSALNNCQFGLLLLTQTFFSRTFILNVELPFLIKNKSVVPVLLKSVIWDPAKTNFKGLDRVGTFPNVRDKAFGDYSSNRDREKFVKELYSKICDLVGQSRLPDSARALPKEAEWEERFRLAVLDPQPKHFVKTQGITGSFEKNSSAAATGQSERKDSLEFLREWISNPNAPPYCALLGEYGMGKTTTCKALARDLLERREKKEIFPLPIYLDLRHAGESAKREIVLPEILDLILKRSWKIGAEDGGVSAQEIIALVQKGALIIWDGLDEVLVHLNPNQGQQFTRQLFRILPPRRKNEQPMGRMLISCRTHYFRTVRDEQAHFRAEDRDDIRASDYHPPFILLPFTTEQIREYVTHTLPEEDPNRVMEVLDSIHNLNEMAERPYTLSLISDQFAEIERWKAEGRRVTGLTLYRRMVLSWLERDSGKHQLTPDHKQQLMEFVAAELWKRGLRSWSVGELEQWLIDFLEDHPRLAAHYHGKDRELLKEDLRTATFLVREGDDRFRFAHTSLQEFFLAGFLARPLFDGKPEAWALPETSIETLNFLGQWLDEGEQDQKDKALKTLAALRDHYRDQASELAFAYFLLAHSKRYLCPSPAGFQLPGVDLRKREIVGSVETQFNLAGANFTGALLTGSFWRYCNLTGADFHQTRAVGAKWLDCECEGSKWQQVNLEGALFRNCHFEQAEFAGAHCDHTQWLGCAIKLAHGVPKRAPQALLAPSKLRKAGLLSVSDGHTSVNACSWSPDGKRIASAGNTLRIWEAGSGECVQTLSGHTSSVTSCAWSADGKRIVSVSLDKTLRIWEARSGECVQMLIGHKDTVNGCAWSPDGKRIVSASGDNTLRIWDAGSWECVRTLTGHKFTVNGCAWSEDGKWIVSASDDHTLRIWEVGSGKCVKTLTGHTDFVNSCSWSADGQRIVSASDDDTLRIWEAGSGKCIRILEGHTNSVNGCAWSGDGKQIVSASADNTLRIWEASSGECVRTLIGHRKSVFACAWSADKTRIVSASSDNTLRIWEASSEECVRALSGQTTLVNSCAWSMDGQRIVSASSTLRIWDTSSGECLRTLTGHTGIVSGCAWSTDGKRIVSASLNHTLQIWDVGSGKCVGTLVGHTGSVYSCAWSPDGKQILSSSSDGTLRIWEAGSGECVRTLTGHTDRVTGCTWSPDGKQIASISWDDTLRTWDAADGTCVVRPAKHLTFLFGCSWSPDGKQIAWATWDNTLGILDAVSGECLQMLVGHSGEVNGCAWSADGKRIVSASDDGTLRIWETVSGECVQTLTGHASSVNSCAWSTDGRRIMSASSDGSIRMWDAQSFVEIGPRLYHLAPPRLGASWCAIDPLNNRILGCDENAWRAMGWIIPNEETGWPEWYPAETFGPLPVVPKNKTRSDLPV